MNVWRNLLTKPALPIAALLSFALIACATSEPQTQPTQVAAASPSAQPTAQAVTRAVHKKAAHKRLASHRKAGQHGTEVAASHTAAKPAPELATSIQPANPPETARLSAGNTASVLARLHRDDLAEIARAKVAEEKTASPEVRSYADQLISDHMAVDQTVVAMAQKDGVQLAEPAPSKGAEPVASKPRDKPESASSKNFDKTFLQQASSDHERLIAKLKRDREDAGNDDVEALIDKVIPILQQDQQLARILMNKEQAS